MQVGPRTARCRRCVPHKHCPSTAAFSVFTTTSTVRRCTVREVAISICMRGQLRLLIMAPLTMSSVQPWTTTGEWRIPVHH